LMVILVMKKNYFNVQQFSLHILEADDGQLGQRITFPERYIDRTENLLDYLNYYLNRQNITFDGGQTIMKAGSVLEFYKPKVDVETALTSAQMTMKLRPKFAVYMSQALADLLGLSSVYYVNPSEKDTNYINLYPRDLHTEYHNLMVLCPNVKMSNVDNRMFPILRMFNVDDFRYNDTIRIEWPSPIYLTLQNVDYLDKISVIIANSYGVPLAGLKFCETLILMHFRQKMTRV